MRGLLIIMAAFGALVPQQGAAEEVSRCIIAVDGDIYLDGPCDIQTTYDGSFTLMPMEDDGDAPSHFAFVQLDGSLIEGFWNGNPPTPWAHRSLGMLTHDAGCWTNSRARICAFR